MATQLNPRRIEPAFFEPRADTVMAWLGMAGLIVNARGTVIIVDPLITVTHRDGRSCSETGLPLLLPFLPLEEKNVLLLDVAYQVHTHLGPDGSAELARTCGAKTLVAYHYGTFEAPEDGGYRRLFRATRSSRGPSSKAWRRRCWCWTPGRNSGCRSRDTTITHLYRTCLRIRGRGGTRPSTAR